ncbi:hypothetical protein Cadr_000002347 [Camelus dromedarius]|uniref:Uncharacterized protein n=1 Tax=Camelus dromedarius TaxID=9838 RepID=A0A5N4EGI1_CAMDR|nr:hypothetical protein Cadr_000002347 [Camelus dromedarius]
MLPKSGPGPGRPDTHVALFAVGLRRPRPQAKPRAAPTLGFTRRWLRGLLAAVRCARAVTSLWPCALPPALNRAPRVTPARGTCRVAASRCLTRGPEEDGHLVASELGDWHGGPLLAHSLSPGPPSPKPVRRWVRSHQGRGHVTGKCFPGRGSAGWNRGAQADPVSRGQQCCPDSGHGSLTPVPAGLLGTPGWPKSVLLCKGDQAGLGTWGGANCLEEPPQLTAQSPPTDATCLGGQSCRCSIEPKGRNEVPWVMSKCRPSCSHSLGTRTGWGQVGAHGPGEARRTLWSPPAPTLSRKLQAPEKPAHTAPLLRRGSEAGCPRGAGAGRSRSLSGCSQPGAQGPTVSTGKRADEGKNGLQVSVLRPAQPHRRGPGAPPPPRPPRAAWGDAEHPLVLAGLPRHTRTGPPRWAGTPCQQPSPQHSGPWPCHLQPRAEIPPGRPTVTASRLTPQMALPVHSQEGPTEHRTAEHPAPALPASHGVGVLITGSAAGLGLGGGAQAGGNPLPRGTSSALLFLLQPGWWVSLGGTYTHYLEASVPRQVGLLAHLWKKKLRLRQDRQGASSAPLHLSLPSLQSPARPPSSASTGTRAPLPKRVVNKGEMGVAGWGIAPQDVPEDGGGVPGAPPPTWGSLGEPGPSLAQKVECPPSPGHRESKGPQRTSLKTPHIACHTRVHPPRTQYTNMQMNAHITDCHTAHKRAHMRTHALGPGGCPRLPSLFAPPPAQTGEASRCSLWPSGQGRPGPWIPETVKGPAGRARAGGGESWPRKRTRRCAGRSRPSPGRRDTGRALPGAPGMAEPAQTTQPQSMQVSRPTAGGAGEHVARGAQEREWTPRALASSGPDRWPSAQPGGRQFPTSSWRADPDPAGPSPREHSGSGRGVDPDPTSPQASRASVSSPKGGPPAVLLPEGGTGQAGETRRLASGSCSARASVPRALGLCCPQPALPEPPPSRTHLQLVPRPSLQAWLPGPQARPTEHSPRLTQQHEGQPCQGPTPPCSTAGLPSGRGLYLQSSTDWTRGKERQRGPGVGAARFPGLAGGRAGQCGLAARCICRLQLEGHPADIWPPESPAVPSSGPPCEAGAAGRVIVGPQGGGHLVLGRPRRAGAQAGLGCPGRWQAEQGAELVGGAPHVQAAACAGGEAARVGGVTARALAADLLQLPRPQRLEGRPRAANPGPSCDVLAEDEDGSGHAASRLLALTSEWLASDDEPDRLRSSPAGQLLRGPGGTGQLGSLSWADTPQHPPPVLAHPPLPGLHTQCHPGRPPHSTPIPQPHQPSPALSGVHVPPRPSPPRRRWLRAHLSALLQGAGLDWSAAVPTVHSGQKAGRAPLLCPGDLGQHPSRQWLAPLTRAAAAEGPLRPAPSTRGGADGAVTASPGCITGGWERIQTQPASTGPRATAPSAQPRPWPTSAARPAGVGEQAEPLLQLQGFQGLLSNSLLHGGGSPGAQVCGSRAESQQRRQPQPAPRRILATAHMLLRTSRVDPGPALTPGQSHRSPGSPSSSPHLHPSHWTPNSGYPNHPHPEVPQPPACVLSLRTAPRLPVMSCARTCPAVGTNPGDIQGSKTLALNGLTAPPLSLPEPRSHVCKIRGGIKKRTHGRCSGQGGPWNSNLSPSLPTSSCVSVHLGLTKQRSAREDTPKSQSVKAADQVKATSQDATPARLREQSPTSPVHVFAVHTLPIHIGPLGAPPPTPHLWLRALQHHPAEPGQKGSGHRSRLLPTNPTCPGPAYGVGGGELACRLPLSQLCCPRKEPADVSSLTTCCTAAGLSLPSGQGDKRCLTGQGRVAPPGSSTTPGPGHLKNGARPQPRDSGQPLPPPPQRAETPPHKVASSLSTSSDRARLDPLSQRPQVGETGIPISGFLLIHLAQLPCSCPRQQPWPSNEELCLQEPGGVIARCSQVSNALGFPGQREGSPPGSPHPAMLPHEPGRTGRSPKGPLVGEMPRTMQSNRKLIRSPSAEDKKKTPAPADGGQTCVSPAGARVGWDPCKVALGLPAWGLPAEAGASRRAPPHPTPTPSWREPSSGPSQHTSGPGSSGQAPALPGLWAPALPGAQAAQQQPGGKGAISHLVSPWPAAGAGISGERGHGRRPRRVSWMHRRAPHSFEGVAGGMHIAGGWLHDSASLPGAVVRGPSPLPGWGLEPTVRSYGAEVPPRGSHPQREGPAEIPAQGLGQRGHLGTAAARVPGRERPPASVNEVPWPSEWGHRSRGLDARRAVTAQESFGRTGKRHTKTVLVTLAALNSRVSGQPHTWQHGCVAGRPPRAQTWKLRPREGPRPGTTEPLTGQQSEAHPGADQGGTRCPGGLDLKPRTLADWRLCREEAPSGPPHSPRARPLIPSLQSAGRGRGTVSPQTIKNHITKGVEPAAFLQASSRSWGRGRRRSAPPGGLGAPPEPRETLLRKPATLSGDTSGESLHQAQHLEAGPLLSFLWPPVSKPGPDAQETLHGGSQAPACPREAFSAFLVCLSVWGEGRKGKVWPPVASSHSPAALLERGPRAEPRRPGQQLAPGPQAMPEAALQMPLPDRKRPSGLQPPCVVHRHCGSPGAQANLTHEKHPSAKALHSSQRFNDQEKTPLHANAQRARQTGPHASPAGDTAWKRLQGPPAEERPESPVQTAPRGQGAGAASRARWAVIPQFPQRKPAPGYRRGKCLQYSRAETARQALKKLNREPPSDAAVLLLGSQPGEFKARAQRDIGILVFTAALLTIAQMEREEEVSLMGTEFGKILETDGGDGGTGTGMNQAPSWAHSSVSPPFQPDAAAQGRHLPSWQLLPAKSQMQALSTKTTTPVHGGGASTVLSTEQGRWPRQPQPPCHPPAPCSLRATHSPPVLPPLHSCTGPLGAACPGERLLRADLSPTRQLCPLKWHPERPSKERARRPPPGPTSGAQGAGMAANRIGCKPPSLLWDMEHRCGLGGSGGDSNPGPALSPGCLLPPGAMPRWGSEVRVGRTLLSSSLHQQENSANHSLPAQSIQGQSGPAQGSLAGRAGLGVPLGDTITHCPGTWLHQYQTLLCQSPMGWGSLPIHKTLQSSWNWEQPGGQSSWEARRGHGLSTEGTRIQATTWSVTLCSLHLILGAQGAPQCR